jgi:hypothetical protein
MEIIWSFIRNVFEIVTNGSYRLANRINNWHLNALLAQIAVPFFEGLYNAYKPISNNFVSAYTKWKNALAIQKAATATLKELLGDLSKTKARAWIAAVEVVYPKGSADYIKLIPNGSKPFQSGSQDDRISAVRTLYFAIGADTSLATLKTDVENTLTLIEGADTAQLAALNEVALLSDMVESTRVEMCIAQYGNLGLLMHHFKKEPDNVAAFFDLKAIRRGLQVLFTGLVAKLKKKMLVQRTFEADEKLKIENEGITNLVFYLSNNKTGNPGTLSITVLAGENIQVNASELGDVATMHFLMVYNPDTINQGEFTVEIV